MRRLSYTLALLFAAAACDEPSCAVDAPRRQRRARRARGRSADLTDVGDAPDAASTDADGADAALPACNGHVAPGDRPFDEVVFAGTHNSMASDEDGFLAPNHNWASRGSLRTACALMSSTPTETTTAWRSATAAALRSTRRHRAAERHRRLLARQPAGGDGVHLPGRRLDGRLAHAFEESGLGALAITPPAAGEPWPTLSELIAADTRALLTHESGNSGPSGSARLGRVRRHALLLSSVDDFSCAQNRGPADAPLRLLNHWLGALPSPALGEEANRYETLQARAEACAAEWGRPPTIVAVDFYDLGAVFDVVDELNGVAAGR